jgi:hypothetical protein
MDGFRHRGTDGTEEGDRAGGCFVIRSSFVILVSSFGASRRDATRFPLAKSTDSRLVPGDTAGV